MEDRTSYPKSLYEFGVSPGGAGKLYELTGVRGMLALGRAIWGPPGFGSPRELSDIAVRLMVTAGDVARLARGNRNFPSSAELAPGDREELEKELGNLVLSVVRWADDLGFDIIECLRRAADSQVKFAESGRPR